MDGIRLNLGSGMRPVAGFVNVDKFGDPDVRHDLEVFPWPWPDDAVAEVLMCHVLEHLGSRPEIYLGILRELYRVCRGDAAIRIVVPHPRHDYFLDDPTHVRAVTSLGLQLFSQRLNRRWIAAGAANTPLGLYLGVDFELVETLYKPSALWLARNPGATADLGRLLEDAALYNNMIEETTFLLRVVKPASID